MSILIRSVWYLVGGILCGQLLCLPLEFAEIHSDIRAQTAAIQHMDNDVISGAGGINAMEAMGMTPKPAGAYSLRQMAVQPIYVKNGTVWFTNQANPGVADADTGLTPAQFAKQIQLPAGSVP